MALLYVTEYATISNMPTVVGQVPLEPPVADYTIPIGAPTSSPPFQPTTRLVRLHCDAVCSLIVGPAPQTATTSNGRFAANQTECRGVPEGRGFVVSVIANV